MDITIPEPKRPLDANTFKSVTSIPYTVADDPLYAGGKVVSFDGDLTEEQKWQVLDLAGEQQNVTTLKDRARDEYQALTAIQNTAGTLTAAQLSNAVRMEAKVLKAMMKLQFGETDTVD
jgi:hypothetical protein